jgi:uncharacterized protein (DUF952 family)
MQIFHIATAIDWAAAKRSGVYLTSTRGRLLADEGFIHASRRDQVPGVWKAFYADAGEPLVLLTIDTDKLTSTWREDPVGDDTYPHVYGPLNASAVVRAQPLDRNGGTAPFGVLMMREVATRFGLALVMLVLAVIGALVGRAVDDSWGGFVGGIVGLAVGAVIMTVVLRRRG